jgi:hypothetical protein
MREIPVLPCKAGSTETLIIGYRRESGEKVRYQISGFVRRIDARDHAESLLIKHHGSMDGWMLNDFYNAEEGF